jgi:8-oxo-dGTP diphosphatase
VADEILTVAALLRREGQTLLVRQPGPGDSRAAWALPGGVVEPGELLIESLVREVRQETGIEVLRVGNLIQVIQSHHPAEDSWSGGEPPQPGGRVTVFVFEVAEWTGDPPTEDAEGFVREARFWSRNKAIELLEDHPSRVMHEPILAYLRGEDRGRVWLYRRDDEGQDRLEWPARETSPQMSDQMRRARAFVLLGCVVILAILIVIVIIGIITLARPFI